MGELVGIAVQSSVGEMLILKNDGNGIRRILSQRLKLCMEKGRLGRRCGHSIIPVDELLPAFSVGEQW